MTEVILVLATVVAVSLLAVTVRRLTETLISLQDTMETLRQPARPPPTAPPPQPAPRNSHPVIKAMAFGTGASRAARHLRNN